MKLILIWTLLLALISRSQGASVLAEDFSTDPVAAARFVQQTNGTESAFIYDSTNRSLLAVLDVDYDDTYYLSSQFGPLTAGGDVSFSFTFRVLAVDTNQLPSVYIGLCTDRHLNNLGDGLVTVLSTTNGRPAISAEADQAAANSGGQAIALDLLNDYLAVGQDRASNRQFQVDLYGGPRFNIPLGSSITFATNGGFSVDRIGLQNGGHQIADYTNGSITVVVDNLSIPAQRPVFLSVSDAIVTEGDNGTTNAGFTVTLNTPNNREAVTVDYTVVGDTATAGLDFALTNGTLTIPTNVTTTNLSVRVFGDRLAEPTETFRLLLSNAVNANLATTQSIGTILDDDLCRITVSDAAVTETPGGTTAVFTVSLSVSNSRAVTVAFATSNETARAGFDYIAVFSNLTFLPGVTSAIVEVPILDDLVAEPVESFVLNLANPAPTNVTCLGCQGRCYITNSTPPPTVFLDEFTNVVEGNPGDTNHAIITVRLSTVSELPVVISLTASNGTAVAGRDFIATNWIVTIAPGQPGTNLFLRIVSDRVHEPLWESNTVRLLSASNAVPGNSVETVFIQDDDPLPGVEVLDTGVREGNAGTTNASFVLRLTNPTFEPIDVHFATADGSAIAGSDYVAAAGWTNWPPEATNTLTVRVPVIGDLTNEADEIFFLRLDSPSNAVLSATQYVATCVITNDDLVCISVADTNLLEGDTGTNYAVFLVTLSGPSQQDVSVRYFARSGTATNGSDFLLVTNLLVFPIGTVTQEVRVPILGDTGWEPDESFFLELTNATGATLCRTNAVGTIVNDDPLEIRIANVSQSEGNSNTTAFVFNLTLTATNVESHPITVEWFLLGGTAMVGNDFLPANGVASFPPGTISTSVTVAVVGDLICEPDETFSVVLTNAVGARIIGGIGIGTILNDDSAILINVSPVTLVEGTCQEVQLSWSVPSEAPITVQYCFSDLPTNVFLVCLSNSVAIDPTNVPSASRSLCCTFTLLPGTVSTNFLICSQRDFIDEPNRTGRGRITVLSGCGRVDPTGTNTVDYVDVDPPDLVSTNAMLREGNSGLTNLCFQLRTTTPYAEEVRVDFRTRDGTATEGLDYLGTNGTVVFPPGLLSTQQVCVPVIGELLYERDESFFLVLSNAVNARLTNGIFTGWITNDDLPPRVVIDDINVVEGTGTNCTNYAIFNLSLLDPTALPATVSFTTANGTALSGQDYRATNGTRVFTFTNGMTNFMVAVPIICDSLDEANETFVVQLSAPIDARIPQASGLGTIVDDDLPDLRVADTNVLEGTGVGITNHMAFTLTLSSTSDLPVMVEYFTQPNSAFDPDDYLGSSNRLVVVFPEGIRTQQVFVPIVADAVNETDEIFFLHLTKATNARIVTAMATGTIVDDDDPCISIGNLTNSEGATMVFEVTLDAPSELPVSVRFNTANNTATAGLDYHPTNGVLDFPSGVTSRMVSVVVSNDLYCGEGLETFRLVLSSPTNAMLCVTQAIGTIIDTTECPVLSLSDAGVLEGASGTVSLLFTAQLSRASPQVVQFNFATSNGTAQAGVDYVATNLAIMFAANSNITTFSVTVRGDCESEPTESLFVVLTNVQFAVASNRVAAGYITNDDLPPALFISPATALEPQVGNTNIVFNLWLGCRSSFTTYVDYVTRDGTAMAGADYLPKSGNVSIPPGATNATIAVTVLADSLDEPDEYFFVDLRNPTNLVLTMSNTIGTILDTNPPCLEVQDTSVIDYGTNRLAMVFTVTLSSAFPLPICASYTTTNRTALAGSDYVSQSGVLCFPPGATNATVTVPVLSNTREETNEFLCLILSNPTNATCCKCEGVGTIILIPNVPPIVSLLDPGPCQTFPTNLALQAEARDPDGVILRVEFFANTNKIGEVRTNAVGSSGIRTNLYELTWLVPAAGDYTLSAVAVDNLFARVTSSVPMTAHPPTTGLRVTNSPTVVEGNSGTTNMVFHVTLASPSCRTVTVHAATADGTALAGSDYLHVSTNLVFPPGVTERQVPVPVLGDLEKETDETFYLQLDSPVNASVSTNGVGTILNDDTNLPPVVMIKTPMEGATLNTCLPVPICVFAIDPDGTVTQVVIYADGNRLGTMPGPVSGNLYKLPWSPGSSGGYALSAVAMDNAGAVSTSATVRVTVQRGVGDLTVLPLANQTRCVCEEVTFSTTASSTDPISYSWRFNGQVIPNETNSSLILKSLGKFQAGTYTVEVSTPCRNLSRSAVLTLNGDHSRNPLLLTNPTPIVIIDHDKASPYPSSLKVGCIPGLVKTLSVTLDGLSHNFPDDVDVVLVSPAGRAVKLMSDTGGNRNFKLTNVVLTFSDTATNSLPDMNRIFSGSYAPTDFEAADSFPAPAPATITATNFNPFLDTDPNGTWSLFVVDDLGGDAGTIARGWSLAIGWDDAQPLLTNSIVLEDGRLKFALISLAGLTHVIEASTDLIHWFPSSTNTMIGTMMEIVAGPPARVTSRFFRAIRCPCLSPFKEDCAPRLSNPVWRFDGRFQMLITSREGGRHVIEASSDLRTWMPVQTISMNGTSMELILPDATNTHRFYRAVCGGP